MESVAEIAAGGYLHLAKWPFALRHMCGLTGHLTNLPFLSRQADASDGAEPANRLSADKASTILFILSSLGTGSADDRRARRNGKCRGDYKWRGGGPLGGGS